MFILYRCLVPLCSPVPPLTFCLLELSSFGRDMLKYSAIIAELLFLLTVLSVLMLFLDVPTFSYAQLVLVLCILSVLGRLFIALLGLSGIPGNCLVLHWLFMNQYLFIFSSFGLLCRSLQFLGCKYLFIVDFFNKTYLLILDLFQQSPSLFIQATDKQICNIFASVLFILALFLDLCSHS